MAHRFTGQPREVMPGRNANLGLSIGPRRNPIFAHSASEKTELTPFAGYGFSQQEPSFSTSYKCV